MTLFSLLFLIPCPLFLFFFSLPLSPVCLSCIIYCCWCSLSARLVFIYLFTYPRLLFPLTLCSLWSPQHTLSLSNLHTLASFSLLSLFLLLPVDISVSLLAVVVGFCGLALLVVSLFVFWKLCWPIWRSKALLSNADRCRPGVLPEAPPAQPPLSRSVSPHPETKAIAMVGRQPSQVQQEAEDDKRRKVPEVKVNGRSSVKILEAAMKISQTSPDIPAEVQQALRGCLTKQAKIQRQTTEPTSSSRWCANYIMNYIYFWCLIARWMTLQTRDTHFITTTRVNSYLV